MTKQSMSDNNNRTYTTALSKGAAMLDETRRLLDYWEHNETLEEFAKRVHENGLLGNATAYRTKDIVKRVFAARFLKPSIKPALILKQIVSSDLPLRTFNEMVFFFTARQDPLVYDFTVDYYWPAVRRGRNVIDNDAVITFLAEASVEGKLENSWSENVSLRMSRCLLGLLKDIGFLREKNRRRKEIVEYRMSDEGVAILTRILHEEGVPDSSLCEHPDWKLFGFKQNEPLARLNLLGEYHGLVVQQAGSVVRLTWYVNSMEELIDALTGKFV